MTDVPTNVYKIGEIIKRLDRQTPQVFIDSKIVRTELGITENLGIDWNIAGTMSGAGRPTVFPFVPEGGMATNWGSLQSALRNFYPENSNEATVATMRIGTMLFFPKSKRGPRITIVMRVIYPPREKLI